jgi:hypothetical protein
MLKAAFQPNCKQIIVTGDDAAMHLFQRIPGTKRVRAQKDTWTVPFSLDVCAELRSLGAEYDAGLSKADADMQKLMGYVEHVKCTPSIETLKPAHGPRCLPVLSLILGQ